MSDGRIRSGMHKGDTYLNLSPEQIEANTSKADTNLCVVCKDVIPAIYEGKKRIRVNRIDCEDEEGDLVSYHLKCYDIEFLGYVTKVTLKKMETYDT